MCNTTESGNEWTMLYEKMEKPRSLTRRFKDAFIRIGTQISRLEDKIIAFILKCLRKFSRKRKPKPTTAEDYYDAVSGRLP